MDGKEHRYWNIVENRRVSGGRTVQRHVLYLGEINDSRHAAWCQTIEAFDEGGQAGKQIALFPEDRHLGVVGERQVTPKRRGLMQMMIRREEVQLVGSERLVQVVQEQSPMFVVNRSLAMNTASRGRSSHSTK
jgi:hypothetical protein